MRRVAALRRLLPSVLGEDGKARNADPDDVRAMQAYVEANRAETTPFDIIADGETPGDDPAQAAAIVRSWAEAGATWWIEAMWGSMDRPDGLELVRRRIAQGPPRISS